MMSEMCCSETAKLYGERNIVAENCNIILISNHGDIVIDKIYVHLKICITYVLSFTLMNYYDYLEISSENNRVIEITLSRCLYILYIYTVIQITKIINYCNPFYNIFFV